MLTFPHGKLLYEKDGHVAILTKNRPEKLNAWDEEMQAAYYEALADAEDDRDIRVIIITGKGRGFNPGANPDLFKDRSATGYHLPPWFHPHAEHDVSPLRRSDKIVIGAINGYAYGAGFGEALWCDLRIMAESAQLGPSWARFAAPAENGTTFNLPALVGIAKALEIYLMRDPIPAARALELGLTNWVVPDAELRPFALEIGHRIGELAPHSTAITKWNMYKYVHPHIEEDLDRIRFAEDITARTEDQVEGGTAFREKRKAVFKGR